MNKSLAIGTILIIILASSIVIGYSQNWFQPSQETPSPSPSTTPTPSATPQPSASPSPTPSASPSTPSMDVVLEVFGNANMDERVDQTDIDYIDQIISGNTDATPYADANNDGAITEDDKAQVNALINGEASYIVLLDGNGELITVSLPVERIVIEYIQNAELMCVLELEDKIVGIDYCVDVLKDFYFPNNPNAVSVGQMYTPDYEAVLNVDPDVLLTFSKATEEKADKLPGVDVIFLGLYYPNVTNPEDSSFIQGILKAGYLFDRVPQASQYASWLLDLTHDISSKTSTLTDKPKVFMTNYPYDPSSATVSAYATIDTLGQVCILSGGDNIASIISGYGNTSSFKVDAEWIIQQNPEYIFLHTVRYTFSGIMRGDPAQGLNVDDTTSIKDCLDAYISRPEFAELDAVKNGNVYIIAGDFRNNAMGGVLGSVYLSKILHPDLFTDLNPEAIHQQYLSEFMHLDYDLDEHGVFLYPPLTINNDTVGIPNGST